MIVREAPSRTLASGTARVLHGVRRDTADGEAGSPERTEAGVVDFARRLVRYPSTFVVGGARYAAETLWSGPDTFSADTDTGAWSRIPISRVPPGAMPLGAPLWLLGALCGAPDYFAVVSHDHVSGVPTTHVRLTVNSDEAERCSPWPLGFPTRTEPGYTFPVEVWLDEDGLIRRMAYDWPSPSSGRTARGLARIMPRRSTRQAYWMTTEFWDFGVDVVMLNSNRLPEEIGTWS